MHPRSVFLVHTYKERREAQTWSSQGGEVLESFGGGNGEDWGLAWPGGVVRSVIGQDRFRTGGRSFPCHADPTEPQTYKDVGPLPGLERAESGRAHRPSEPWCSPLTAAYTGGGSTEHSSRPNEAGLLGGAPGAGLGPPVRRRGHPGHRDHGPGCDPGPAPDRHGEAGRRDQRSWEGTTTMTPRASRCATGTTPKPGRR